MEEQIIKYLKGVGGSTNPIDLKYALTGWSPEVVKKAREFERAIHTLYERGQVSLGPKMEVVLEELNV